MRNKATNYHLPRHTYQFRSQYFWKQFLHPLLPVLCVCFQSCSLSPDSLSSEKFSVSLIDYQKVTVWAGVVGCALNPSAWGIEADGPLSWGHPALHSECQVSQVSQCYIVRPCFKSQPTNQPKTLDKQKTKQQQQKPKIKILAVAGFTISELQA